MAAAADAKSCRKCKAENATFDLRNLPTCQDCYVSFVDGKVGLRLNVLNRETRTSSKPEPRRYLAGLSFGPSSSAMAHALDARAKFYSLQKSTTPLECLVVHVDTNLTYPGGQAADTPAQQLLARYREKYPNVSFESVHLCRVLDVKTIDWATLPGTEGGDAMERLRYFFEHLPSTTSKADILRLFIRHLLLNLTIEKSYTALLLGHSTTALASLTLSEVASGRGFAVPWQVNDGPYTVCTYDQTPVSATGPSSRESSRTTLPVYYPMREVFKGEITKYIEFTPSLGALIPGDSAATSSVVSHKDLSIEEVVGRYFESVEGPYSGIVANVVRITGKLDRAEGGGSCRLCGMTLDELGDSRWAGELGDDAERPSGLESGAKLCYGCRRSLNG